MNHAEPTIQVHTLPRTNSLYPRPTPYAPLEHLGTYCTPRRDLHSMTSLTAGAAVVAMLPVQRRYAATTRTLRSARAESSLPRAERYARRGSPQGPKASIPTRTPLSGAISCIYNRSPTISPKPGTPFPVALHHGTTTEQGREPIPPGGRSRPRTRQTLCVQTNFQQ